MATIHFLSGDYAGHYILEINGKPEGFISLAEYYATRNGLEWKYGDIQSLLGFMFPAIYSVESTGDYQKYKVVNNSADRIEGYIDIYPISKQIIYIRNPE